MDEKKRILRALAATAKELGRTPSLAEFTGRTKLTKNRVLGLFSKWNEAVHAAGLKPARVFRRLGKDELLEDWGRTVRELGRMPSRIGYLRAGRHSPVSLATRFGWEAVPQAFREFAEGKGEWRDVLAIIGKPVRGRTNVLRAGGASTIGSSRKGVGLSAGLKSRFSRNGFHSGEIAESKLRGRTEGELIYGDPVDIRGLRHEPMNEQGVVLLFGMLAEDLGFRVESVQTAFPDCEAKRQIGPGRWQRVRIEFEFESRKFHDHRHPSTGCDVIVCWRHNWRECPKHLEVVELERVVRSQLPTSANG